MHTAPSPTRAAVGRLFKDFVKKYTTHLRLPALPATLVGHLGCHLGRVLSLSNMPRVKAAQ